MAAKKTSKKGIVLTAAIVGGIVAASFLVYLIPSSPANDVARIADPGTELAFAFDRNEAVVDEFQSAFGAWKNDELTKNEFDERANTAVGQVDVLMLELRRSSPPEEWAQSYVLYIQALDNYKAYFEKTKEYVSAANSDPSRGETLLNSMSELLAKADDLAQQSEDAMPS
ncbi:MAG: hypothetical protein HMLIMOIP_002265 [Candidatus Nitrosomirales archaeon]